MVQNDSGGDCQEGDVRGIDDALIDPTQGDPQEVQFVHLPAYSGITPADPDHLGMFIITAEPIPTARSAGGSSAASCRPGSMSRTPTTITPKSTTATRTP